MAFMLRIRPHRAHGTSLAVVLAAAVAGVYQYAGHGHVRWSVAILLALGGVLGAMIGARLTSAFRALPLRQAFGVLVAILGIVMIVLPASYANQPRALIPSHLHGWPVIVLVGVLAGTVSGLLGTGGGIIMVPAILFLLGESQKMAQGISLAVIIPAALSGALIHARKGNVIPNLAGWLACGAVVGAIVMGHRVGSIENDTLKMIFGVFLIAVGVSMVTRHRKAVAPSP
jgi:hypothetical protein